MKKVLRHTRSAVLFVGPSKNILWLQIVQFKTEGNGRNEIVSHTDRSEVKLYSSEKNCDISYTEQDFETEKFHGK